MQNEAKPTRVLLKFKSFAAQEQATFAYWHDRSIAERMEATAELVRSGYQQRGMTSMLKDQKDLLSGFNAAGVEYVVIGGHAVNAYGVPRMTKDLDVLIRTSAENGERVYRALVSFGAPLADTTAEDFQDGETIFQLGVEPSRVDIIQSIPAVSFDRAPATSSPAQPVPVPLNRPRPYARFDRVPPKRPRPKQATLTTAGSG